MCHCSSVDNLYHVVVVSVMATTAKSSVLVLHAMANFDFPPPVKYQVPLRELHEVVSVSIPLLSKTYTADKPTILGSTSPESTTPLLLRSIHASMNSHLVLVSTATVSILCCVGLGDGFEELFFLQLMKNSTEINNRSIFFNIV